MVFIYLTHEIGISDHKDMNSGWIFTFFKHKEGWYFNVCFSYVYRVWISDKEWKNFELCFSSVYGGVNFWQRMDEFQDVFHMFTGVWISDNEESETKVLPKKKSDKSDICHTTHPYDIFSQFQELNGWKTGSHNVCLEFDGINSKNVTFIWLNLHAWGLIMSYYGLKWKQI